MASTLISLYSAVTAWHYINQTTSSFHNYKRFSMPPINCIACTVLSPRPPPICYYKVIVRPHYIYSLVAFQQPHVSPINYISDVLKIPPLFSIVFCIYRIFVLIRITTALYTYLVRMSILHKNRLQPPTRISLYFPVTFIVTR